MSFLWHTEISEKQFPSTPLDLFYDLTTACTIAAPVTRGQVVCESVCVYDGGWNPGFWGNICMNGGIVREWCHSRVTMSSGAAEMCSTT